MSDMRPTFGALIAASPDALLTHMERRMALLAAREKANVDARASKEEAKPYPVTKGVAEIFIEGPLFQRGLAFWGFIWWDGYDLIVERMLAALNDPDVDSIVVRIDSPGGDVAGCFEASRAIRSAIAKSGKDVFVYVDELCASAAYALACCFATKGILIPPEGQSGSIGVVCRHVDMSKALEKAGLKVTEVTNPDGKTAGFSPYKPLDDEGEARLREMVDTYAATFIQHVASARNIKEKEIRGFNARLFIGGKAVDMGLCDGVASYAEVLARAMGSARNAQEARMSKSLITSLLGLAENATTEQTESAIAAHRALVGLGKEAMRITGQTDPDAAKGVLLAQAESAKKLPEVQSQLSSLQAAHDAAERVKLCEEGVRRGIPAALLWKDGDKAKGVSEWAGPIAQNANGEPVGQSLAQLRGYVHAHQTSAVITTKHDPAADPENAVATQRAEAFAKQHNVDPIAAQIAAQIIGG